MTCLCTTDCIEKQNKKTAKKKESKDSLEAAADDGPVFSVASRVPPSSRLTTLFRQGPRHSCPHQFYCCTACSSHHKSPPLPRCNSRPTAPSHSKRGRRKNRNEILFCKEKKNLAMSKILISFYLFRW